MKGRLSGNIKRLIISLLILTGFSSAGFSFQKKITTNENIYKNVVAGGASGTDSVIVDNLVDFDKFKPGDTILIIQMKGLQIDVPESASYGTPHNFLGSPGKYEFMIIESTDIPTRKLKFKNNLINHYDLFGDVQVIRVPSYNSAIVEANITCPPWDSISKTGGVLTMIVGKTLTLNANIDVSGKGFIGGAIASGDGICADPDPVNLQKYAYPLTYTNSGFKGESVVAQAWIDAVTQVSIYPAYAKGKGANFNGGGGGNGRFSGGGGGSNSGAGGKGGRENNDICSVPLDGGLGGRQIRSTALAGGIYLGGGGGGSTHSGGTASAGGPGGGIVIIICNDIVGNGHIIAADGATPAAASGTAGSGGGGAGGSIAIYLESFSTTSNLTLSAKGARGGNNAGTFGEGGGGGGGLIWTNNISVPVNITRNIAFGLPGTRSGGSTAGAGAIGDTLRTYVPILNGFLFNSIRSSGTYDQTDSICSNQIPYIITGTKPVGGSTFYTYLWQKKNNSGGAPVNIPLSNVQNFTFSAPEPDTFFIRRVVKDDISLLTDTSKWVEIRVQPFIKNNTVGNADTICYNGDPPLVQQLLPDIKDGNPKYYLYKWQVSIDNSTWGPEVAATKNYDPPAGLIKSSWYRRTVTSGRCVDSTAKALITVLDTIKNNNITSPAEEICHGMIFNNITATVKPVLSGGDNVFRYKWESSDNGTTWNPAPGTITDSVYNPVESSPTFPGKEYFRRIVYSGIHNVCSNASLPVLLTDWPVITNNTILDNQTICSGSIPAPLTGTIPVNGNGTYAYLWLRKTRIQPWSPAPGTNNTQNYTPPALTDTTWYRRVSTSSFCSDSSNIIVVNVHLPITNNNVLLLSGVKWDTTICSGATPAILKGTVATGGTDIPGSYAFLWESSSNKLSGYVSTGATGKDFQPPVLTNATAAPVFFYYRRSVTSGTCFTYSDSVITIKVLPLISNNTISSNQTICYNTVPAQLTGPVLTGGAGGTPTWLWQESPDGTVWVTATGGTSNQQNYSPPALTVPMKYRRIIFSGPVNCCIDTSNVITIGINPLPTGAITSVSDTTVCGGLQVPLKIHLTGASKWKLIYTENGSQIIINKILGQDTTLYITKTPVTGLETFNYALFSVQDNNGCFATALSGTRKIDVYKVPKAVPGQDASICGPKYSFVAAPSAGIGTWYKVAGPGNATFAPNINAANAVVAVDSLGTAWTPENIYTFRWKEVNWQCKDSASVTIKFYKRTGPANAGPDKDLYSFDKVDTLRALKPLVGTGIWSVISGSGTISNDSIVSNLSGGENKFEWTVANGACVSKDQVIITVHDLKIPEGFSPNNDMVNDEFVVQGLDISYSEVSLRIVNSAGTEVFFSSNADGNTFTSWNGENESGILPEGTYYYLLTIKSLRNGTVYKKSGFIILKRYNFQ